MTPIIARVAAALGAALAGLLVDLGLDVTPEMGAHIESLANALVWVVVLVVYGVGHKTLSKPK